MSRGDHERDCEGDAELPRQSDRWASDFVCYNVGDPCAFLTWGPRGATAGLGKEIQLILWMIWKENPALIERAFGAEAGNLQRFFRLKGLATRDVTQKHHLSGFCARSGWTRREARAGRMRWWNSAKSRWPGTPTPGCTPGRV
jgi:hypothetical protein